MAQLDDILVRLAELLGAMGREDLARRVTIAVARLRRPSTVVCVVGEFKQGKSSLVNALLGVELCPVDDDLATSTVTLVRHGEQPGAVVHRRDPSADPSAPPIAEPIAIGDVPAWVTEAGNPGNRQGVERVDISAPATLLEHGLVLVDTPGAGGLAAGHAAATKSFLPFADGLLFVSDASSELTASEIDFLRAATELCPTVLFVQCKTDLYPEWRRILQLNTDHLASAGLSVPVVAVSSALRMAALDRHDAELNDLSGVPEVLRHLVDDVVVPARSAAGSRALSEALALIDQVAGGLRAEQQLLHDPSTVERTMEELTGAKARLEYLRGPGARWSVLLGDRVTDLSNDVNYRCRSAMRTITRSMDDKIEHLTKGSQWDELAQELQTSVAEEVARTFGDLEQGRQRIRDEAIELLQEEHLDLDPAGTGAAEAGLDVGDFWRARSLDPRVRIGKKAFGTTVTTVRGAQGGIYMFGMLGSFLPSAARLLIASNPVLLGVGALFGTIGLTDDHNRKVAARRQAARTQVRQFLDDVQFELGNQVGAMVRDIQRDLRDQFGLRITELLRTYTETAQRAQADLQRSEHERSQRTVDVGASLAQLQAIDQELRGAT